jgi:HEAT repeat protein
MNRMGRKTCPSHDTETDAGPSVVIEKGIAQMTPAKRKKLFWQIPLLLILGLTNLGLVRWYAMRFNSDDPEIQASAANALSRMGPKAKGAVPTLIATLDSGRPEVRDAAARVLGEIGPDAEAAVESLIRIQKTEREFLTVEKALGQIGEPGLDPLITDLQDNNASVREHAAESLGRILLVVPDPKLAQKAMQPLINALQDEDLRVRIAATMAMRGLVIPIKDRGTRAKVAEAVVRAMKDRGVHPTFASGVLIEIADASLEPLINALQDDNVGVRWYAALAMQMVLPAVEDPQIRARAAEPLIRTMEDADWEVLRDSAAVALSKIDTENAKNALRDAGFDPAP